MAKYHRRFVRSRARVIGTAVRQGFRRPCGASRERRPAPVRSRGSRRGNSTKTASRSSGGGDPGPLGPSSSLFRSPDASGLWIGGAR
jgi:hypothetical protein